MAKSLQKWCEDNGKEELLEEWNPNKNSRITTEAPYNTVRTVSWICKKGHVWRCPLVARTLFGRGCPICDSKMKVLPVGTKYGCLTIIGDYSVHEEVIRRRIEKLEEEKQECLQEPAKAHFIDREIEGLQRQDKYYLCQCKCGIKLFKTELSFLESEHRYCDSDNFIYQGADCPTFARCGLRDKPKKRTKLV